MQPQLRVPEYEVCTDARLFNELLQGISIFLVDVMKLTDLVSLAGGSRPVPGNPEG